MGSRVRRTLALVLTLALLISCGAVRVTEPPVPDPPPAPVGETDCERAGDRLSVLGCDLAETPQGVPFQEACEAAAKDGRNWRPDCIMLVTSCGQVEAAFRKPEGEPCK